MSEAVGVTTTEIEEAAIGDADGVGSDDGAVGTGTEVSEAAPAPVRESSDHLGDEVLPSDDRVAEAGSAAGEVDVDSHSNIEEEGDIAADYIEELLDICDLDGDIDIDARGGRAYVSVNSSEDSNLRLLSNPETVQALQELTRLAVQTKSGGFSRLILDVGGSRQIREAELGRLVGSAIDRIEVGGEVSVALAPMSSYERKVVHDLVAERGFVSASEGEGRDRHTVISAA